jgi:hypothetical protein
VLFQPGFSGKEANGIHDTTSQSIMKGDVDIQKDAQRLSWTTAAARAIQAPQVTTRRVILPPIVGQQMTPGITESTDQKDSYVGDKP